MRYFLFYFSYFLHSVYVEHSTSQIRVSTFQVLGSHMWPVATMLGSTDLEHIPSNIKEINTLKQNKIL